MSTMPAMRNGKKWSQLSRPERRARYKTRALFAERRAFIAAQRRNGLTYAEIGHVMGICRQRVYAILNGRT